MQTAGRLEIEGKDYGEMLLEDQVIHGQNYPPWSYLWCCRHCGRVWARLTIPDSTYHIWAVTCSSCKAAAHNLEGAGSVLLCWERSFNDALPEEAIRREFQLVIRDMEEELLI